VNSPFTAQGKPTIASAACMPLDDGNALHAICFTHFCDGVDTLNQRQLTIVDLANNTNAIECIVRVCDDLRVVNVRLCNRVIQAGLHASPWHCSGLYPKIKIGMRLRSKSAGCADWRRVPRAPDRAVYADLKTPLHRNVRRTNAGGSPSRMIHGDIAASQI
jgi:hypothetical protein